MSGNREVVADGFFEEIGDKAAKLTATRQAQNDRLADNHAFVAEVMPAIRRLAISYAERLTLLGLKASVRTNGNEDVVFTLTFADGGGVALRVGNDAEHGFLVSEETGLGDYGVTRPFTGVFSYERSTWSFEAFEAGLQKLVREFTDAAPFHDGL